VSQYQSIVDAEWKIIYEKMEKCVATGAKVVLSKLPIGDLATQYFADRGIFCAGRVPADDLQRVAVATGGQVQASCNGIKPENLGRCELFEEKQIGMKRYNFFSGCPCHKTSTIILRGGGQQFIDEADRSLHDAICIVKRAVKTGKVVGGGGAVEMELSKMLREHSRTIRGKMQMVIAGYARALEVIPRQLAENAGHNATDILNKLRQKHYAAGPEGLWFGVDILNGGVCDTYKSFVWEPVMVKKNALQAATEAACLILSIDETIKNQESDGAKKAEAAGRPRGGAMPVSQGGGMGAMMKGMPGVTKLKGRR